MEINKKELLETLESVKPGLSNKEFIDQSTSFAFVDGYVITYNDEISVRAPLKDLDITTSIKAEELYSLLKKFKKDVVNLELTETELMISCGRSKAGISIEQEIKLPIEEIGKIGKMIPIEQELLNALEFAAPVCSKDMSQAKLTCIHLNSNGFVEATDNFRVIRIDVDIPFETVLIPGSCIKHILSIKPTKIKIGNGWVHFKNKEGVILSCRTFDDTFPDTTNLIKVKGNKIKLPNRLEEIIDRAKIFTDYNVGYEEQIQIRLENNNLRISTKNDNGWYEENVKVQYDDVEISFNVIIYTLLEIIKKTRYCYISDKLLTFKGENWVYSSAIIVNK